METVIALIAAAFVATTANPNQGPQWLSCERVDQGGYFTFADPTCPNFPVGSEYETVVDPVTGEETTVATN